MANREAMTLPRACTCFLPLVLLGGCMQAPLPATLEPWPTTTGAGHAANRSRGKLLVFSAYNIAPPPLTELDATIKYYTPYEVRNERHELVARVRNGSGSFDSAPTPLDLPAGRYEITARTQGSGYITLPLEISAATTTVVHLDGDQLPAGATAAHDELIRASNGKVVGWCATQ